MGLLLIALLMLFMLFSILLLIFVDGHAADSVVDNGVDLFNYLSNGFVADCAGDFVVGVVVDYRVILALVCCWYCCR